MSEFSGQMPAPTVTPFEALIAKRSPFYLASFEHGTTVLRAALGSCSAEHTLTLTPLRGAMPMIWSADGSSEYESPVGARFVEVPLGTFKYVSNRDGKQKEASPRTDQKAHILKKYFMQALEEDGRDPEATSLAIVDEVQKGGTLGTAVAISRKLIEDMGLASQLKVFAAQDIRESVVGEEKTPAYQKIASNHISNTPATVIPMPLIATDREPLLDEVVLPDGFKDLRIENKLQIVRNVEAERLFRTLGSMARVAELRHDESFMDAFIDAQGNLSEKAAGRVEVWKSRIVELMDHFQAPA